MKGVVDTKIDFASKTAKVTMKSGTDLKRAAANAALSKQGFKVSDFENLDARLAKEREKEKKKQEAENRN